MSTFLHSGDLGDLIYALPTIRALGGGDIILTPGEGTREPMTMERRNFVHDYLVDLPYIGVVLFKKREAEHGKDYDYDFTGFRTGIIPGETLAESQRRWVAPNLKVDFSVPWLSPDFTRIPTVSPREFQEFPAICRTDRYHNPEGTALYKALCPRGTPLILGLKEEGESLVNLVYGYWHPTTQLRYLINILTRSRLVVCNQSLVWALCVGLGKRAILEVCTWQPDCIFDHDDLFYYRSVADLNGLLGLVAITNP